MLQPKPVDFISPKNVYFWSLLALLDIGMGLDMIDEGSCVQGDIGTHGGFDDDQRGYCMWLQANRGEYIFTRNSRESPYYKV